MILSFVGVKMLISSFYKIPVAVSLGVIAGLLAVAVIASLVRAKRLEGENEAVPDGAEA